MIYAKKLKTITLKVKENPAPQQQVSAPKDAFNILRAIYTGLDDDQEHFTVLFLNVQNKITGYKTLFSGGQDSAHVDTRIIFKNALIFGATGIITAHNHPTGDLSPSLEDRKVHNTLTEAGDLLGVKVLDSLIISATDYYSFNS